MNLIVNKTTFVVRGWVEDDDPLPSGVDPSEWELTYYSGEEPDGQWVAPPAFDNLTADPYIEVTFEDNVLTWAS
jgi:hypothetical protein